MVISSNRLSPLMYRHCCAIVLAAMIVVRNLPTKLTLWKTKMLKCEERSDDCLTSSNCSKSIIVYHSSYYSLFTTPLGTFHHFTPLGCGVVTPTVAFDLTTLAESSGVVLQPIIMVVIGQSTHGVQL
ncbi:hypothetical protein TNCV_4816931 [Trichonephila clavipes]|nr:hypothetical protein TNCV_4816931 [Trichonephila clavipes]